MNGPMAPIQKMAAARPCGALFKNQKLSAGHLTGGVDQISSLLPTGNLSKMPSLCHCVLPLCSNRKNNCKFGLFPGDNGQYEKRLLCGHPFVSSLYGGRISDKELTKRSGLLQKMEPGYFIRADRGFDIDDVLPDWVSTNIPPFLGSWKQLESEESEEVVSTRWIATVHIHVERAIERIKNFRITHFFQATLCPIAEHIVHVCAFLTLFDCCRVKNHHSGHDNLSGYFQLLINIGIFLLLPPCMLWYIALIELALLISFLLLLSSWCCWSFLIARIRLLFMIVYFFVYCTYTAGVVDLFLYCT